MAKIALVLILCSCLQIANAHFLASNATWKENLEVRLFGEEAGDNRRLEAEDEMVYPTVIPEDEDELEDLIDDETDFEDEPDGPDVADARRLSNDFELTWEYIMDENNVEGPLLDYLVVGAGISGVSSVKIILERNATKEVRLVEASNHIGGRIMSKKIADAAYRVELGASFITGLKSRGRTNNPIRIRQQEQALTGRKNDYVPIEFLNEDGVRDQVQEDYSNTNSGVGRLYSSLDLALDVYYYCIFVPTDDAEFNNPDEGDPNWCKTNTNGEVTAAIRTNFPDRKWSFGQVVSWQEWDRATLPPQFTESIIKNAEIFELEADYGINLDQAEIGFDWGSMDFRGGNYIVVDTRGFKHIPESFLADDGVFDHVWKQLSTDPDPLVEKVRITDNRLWKKTKVVAIRYNPDDVDEPALVAMCKTRRIGGRGINPISFECKSGAENYKIVRAKKVITTLPLNVMRNSYFLEQAGATLAQSINRAPRFDPPLMDQGVGSQNLGAALEVSEMGYLAATVVKFKDYVEPFWGHQAEYLLSGRVDQGFEGSFVPYWTNFRHKKLQRLDPDARIVKVFYAAERALDVESKPISQIKREMVDSLNHMFPNDVKYNDGQDQYMLTVDDIDKVRQSRWSRDELTGGAYSSGRMAETDDTREAIKKPRGAWIPSGEHTCTRYAGYVHGGFFSGERAVLMAEDPNYEHFCEDEGWESNTP